MAATHGSSAEVYAPGFDFGAFLREIKSSSETDALDTTVFADNGNKTFILGMRDGKISGEGLWVGTPSVTTDIDPVMEGLQRVADQPWLYLPYGDALGNHGKLLTGGVTKWESESPNDDINKCSLEVQSTASGAGIELVKVHRALASAAIATDSAGTAVDNGAGTSNGGVGYLLATANGTPGTLDVKIQHSTDNSVWADLITFSQVDGPNEVQRIAVSGTVNRYTRVIHTVATGAVTYHASFGRK